MNHHTNIQAKRISATSYWCLLGLMLLAPLRLHAQQLTNNARTRGFIENKGQIKDQNGQLNPTVKFLLCLPGLNVQLKANSFSYDTYTMSSQETHAGPFAPQQKPEQSINYTFNRVDIEFIGANPHPEIISELPGADVLNYYTNGTQTGIQLVRHFQKITYKQLYPGIDLEFLAQPGSSKPVEYNFIVSPGAAISQIKWHYTGADKTSLQNEKIVLQLPNGMLYESIPLTYEKETRKVVPLKYQSCGNGVFGFAPPTYKKQHTLIIDPFPDISWAAYVGGNDRDQAMNVDVDDSDYVYVSGVTITVSGFATAGAHQTVMAGLQDIFLMKRNEDGTILWTTYFGSTDSDFLGETTKTMDIDAGGNVLIAGQTTSASGLATAGAAQTTYGGGAFDGFIVKFTRQGALEWCTYIGGEGQDQARTIAADPNGNIFITGYSNSLTGISTSGTLQPSNGGGFDAIIVKYNAAGNLLWSTYYGGTTDDFGFGCAADPNGNVFVSLFTHSSGLATSGAHQTSPSALDDNIIMKLSSTGTRLWATYYGGPGQESITGLVTDASGNLYFSGASSSLSDVATIGSNSGGQDALVGKFNSSGVRQWARYIGGSTGADATSGSDAANAIALDPQGNICITGQTTSQEGLATLGAPQMTYGGGTLYIPALNMTLVYYDTYVAKLDNNGNILWSTYYGGSGYEWPMAVAVNSKGKVMTCGYTTSLDKIATPGSVQPSMLGTLDGYLVMYEDLKGSNNAAVTRLLTPSSTFCPSKQKISVEIANRGTNLIIGAKIGWSINGVVQNPVNFSSVLLTWGKATIQLDSINFQQDSLVQLKVWTYLPNGVADTINTDDTLNVSLKAGLSGSYTITSSGGNYQSFSEAAYELNQFGVCGPVIFTADTGTYNEQILLKSIPGSSAVNTVTFKGIDRNKVILHHTNNTADTATLTLDKTQQVRFSNMTIQSDMTVINLKDGCLNNNFSNLNIFTDSMVAGFNAINISHADIILFDSLLVRGGFNGIAFTGDSNNYSIYNRIHNSLFEAQMLTSIIGTHQNLLNIRNNYIPEWNGAGTGINLLGSANFEISNNRIYGKSIDLSEVNKKNWNAAYQTRIANNMISNTSSPLILYDAMNLAIYHNSLLSTDATGNAVLDISSNNGGIDLRNNQIIDASGSNKLVSSTGSALFSYMNSNNYYPNSGGFYIDGNVYADLSSLKSGFPGFNLSSYTVDPLFASGTSLYTNVYLQGEPVNIMNDIDGLLRCASKPYVGANEKDRSFTQPIISTVTTTFFKGIAVDFMNSLATVTNKELEFDWFINDIKVSDSTHLNYIFPDSGTYTVKLNAGNCAKTDSSILVIRVINGRPSIILLGNALDSIPVFSTYVDPGATAKDGLGIDISANIIVNSNLDTAHTGLYEVWYIVSDPASGVRDSVLRKIKVYDNVAPSITRNGADTITIEVFSVYSEPGATLSDNYCPNPLLHINGNVDTAIVGTYQLTYTAEDCDGNFSSSVSRVVHVVDTEAPLIRLNGSDSVTLLRWQGYTDAGYTLSDNYYPFLSIDVDTLGNWVNSQQEGYFYIEYSATDGSGNTSKSARRIIRVIDISSSIVEPATIVLALYPNPGNGTFTLELDPQLSNNVSLNVTDASGKTVYETLLSGGTNRLNLEFLSAGIYQLHLQQGTYVQVLKCAIIH